MDLNQVLSEVELAYENPGISEGTPMVTRALGWLPPVNRYRLSENLNEDQTEDHFRYWKTYGDACKLFCCIGIPLMINFMKNDMV